MTFFKGFHNSIFLSNYLTSILIFQINVIILVQAIIRVFNGHKVFVKTGAAGCFYATNLFFIFASYKLMFNLRLLVTSSLVIRQLLKEESKLYCLFIYKTFYMWYLVRNNTTVDRTKNWKKPISFCKKIFSFLFGNLFR